MKHETKTLNLGTKKYLETQKLRNHSEIVKSLPNFWKTAGNYNCQIQGKVKKRNVQKTTDIKGGNIQMFKTKQQKNCSKVSLSKQQLCR